VNRAHASNAAGPTVPVAERAGGWGATDLLMFLAILIWGINFTAVKFAVGYIAPLAYNAVRFSLATVVTMTVLVVQARKNHDPSLLRMSRHDIIPVILLGLAGHTIYQAIFASGVALSTPANASLLLATAPIWVAILGYILRIERINLVMLAGILMSFAGITLLITSGGQVELGRETLVGNAMLLGCAVLWAVYTTASKPFLGRFSPLKLTGWSMVAGTIPLILISIPDLRRQDWSTVPPLVWAALLFSAVFAVTVGYTIWYSSVQRVGNARTAVYSNLTPIVAILFAWLTLGDALAPVQLLGAAIVLAGLIVTRRGRTR
jgi:drug/metabolite transporter (DMT)-like permease